MIPEAAVEAAWIETYDRGISRVDIQLILEAAAPHMVEQGWDDAPLDPRDYDKARL